MKKHYRFFCLLAVGTLLFSCSKEYDTENFANNEADNETESIYTRAFAEPDGSKHLNGTPSENLKALFDVTDPDMVRSLGRMNITESQYDDIKIFTDDLVANDETQTEKYQTIFKWLSRNITFNDYSNPAWHYLTNDPYEVFINRVAVCEGYSNLMVVMCHSQEIPAVVVNGNLATQWYDLGHAWVYTCPDKVWTVSDPTNGGSWKMDNLSGYTHLKPMMADVDFFKNEVGVFNYFDYAINLKEVTTTEPILTVPYSVNGFVISSFNPSVTLPEGLTEIYLGQNITTLGETYNMGLLNNDASVQAIYVDENNPTLMDNKGIVYKKNGGDPQLYYIPAGMTFIELLPMKLVDKNTIYNHMNVEEIYFPEGTKRLENYAIENCPKLKRIYIPADAEVAKEALYNCPQNVEIIRGAPSCIHNITMD